MSSPNTINLHGIWKLRCEARGIEVDYPVPGDVHSALIAAGQIPDPYKGTNEFACRWVADEEWVASRTFHIDQIEGEWQFDIDYLDTVATVKVNGVEVLKAENCFRRFQPDVTRRLHQGENTVEVILHSNTKTANAKQAEQPFYIPYHAGNCPIPNGNMLRKPQCHFGWDWNLAIVPFGLCGQFALKRTPGIRIADVIVVQRHLDNGDVELTVSTTLLVSPGTNHFRFDLEFGDMRISRNLELDVGEARINETFAVKDPELWWPFGQGDQVLHDLHIHIGEEQTTRRIGLRQSTLHAELDTAGRQFQLSINGREIFCKGANWIPSEALPSRATPELTRKLLEAAVDANMNMIRVWGGGYYEQDWFYDICDEIGILVWQDFQFSCNLYPSTEEFLENVKLEVRDQVARLQHHACIALWCGDNELIGALTWFDESRKNRDRYLVSYDRLNRTIEEAAKSVDPNLNWWPSSPSPGRLDFGDAWHDDSKGDMHFWSVWHEGKDFEHYHDVKPRFCSEFGFQSFPSLRICKELVESAEDLNISSAVMEHHQRNSGGNARIAETMFRYFRFPMDFGNFVYLSQVQQGLAMRMAVEYWRSLKPHCMGTLYWQLNDTWPVASWSGLDHGGGWKLLHYMARRFYAQVLITARKSGDEIVVSAVHDLPEVFETEVEVQRLDVSGVITTLYKKTLTLSGDGQELMRLDARHFSNDSILLVTWRDEKGITRRNHMSAMPYKHLQLPNPQIDCAVTEINGALSITLSAKHLALYVALECDVAGHFSDNAFDLLGGERITINFTPDTPSDLKRAASTIVIRDLYSSSH